MHTQGRHDQEVGAVDENRTPCFSFRYLVSLANLLEVGHILAI